MMGKSTKYEFGLNEEFENTGMDGVKHKVISHSAFIKRCVIVDKLMINPTLLIV